MSGRLLSGAQFVNLARVPATVLNRDKRGAALDAGWDKVAGAVGLDKAWNKMAAKVLGE